MPCSSRRDQVWLKHCHDRRFCNGRCRKQGHSCCLMFSHVTQTRDKPDIWILMIHDRGAAFEAAMPEQMPAGQCSRLRDKTPQRCGCVRLVGCTFWEYLLL